MASFLSPEDYKVFIKNGILDTVISSDQTLLDDAEVKAQSEMSSYLRIRFDVPQIFNKTGSSRNPVIILKLVDMVLYHVHSRINPKQIPDLRVERYENAIKWLKDVAKGLLDPDLPKVADGAKDKIVWGSNERRSSHY